MMRLAPCAGAVLRTSQASADVKRRRARPDSSGAEAQPKAAQLDVAACTAAWGMFHTSTTEITKVSAEPEMKCHGRRPAQMQLR